MYQRSSHEPRYKQSTRAQEPRHAESNDYSEVCSSEEEEEESTDRCTEDTEEDSMITQDGLSLQESDKTEDIDRRASPKRRNSCDKYCVNSYLSVSKASKKDQFTQKNLLSPFPSYWAPPVQKEVSGGANCKVSNIMPIAEESCRYRPGDKSPGKRESEKDGYPKRTPNETDRKWEKQKSSPTKIYPEQSGRRDERESSGKLMKPLGSGFSEINQKLGALSSRRPKTSSRDMNSFNQKNCPDCSPEMEARSKSKRRPSARADCSQKDPRTNDSILSKDMGDGKLVKNKGKEVKEKLVYVVEEEGKNSTKIETDLFSLNEILNIKKDLIELGEFAKKLKKLKEQKKDSESDRNKKNPCHCHPAEDLLKDVNKRIEALEARQEELERKSQCGNPKKDTKIPPKKLVKSSQAPPKTPNVASLSATKKVPCDPKREMIVTRAEGFACNSDIVNELMDIKTQLEKLEKKRMLKDVSNETIALKETNLSKTKDHAIAVFSSKTYILTTENFEKEKPVGGKSKKEMTKENVVNWLKNVSLERADNEVNVFLSADAKRDENLLKAKQRVEEIKCQNCNQVSKPENFENQEPQKNRATENKEKGVDMSFTYFVKNQSFEGSNHFGEPKKCFVTSSGKFVAVVSKTSVNIEKVPPKNEDPGASGVKNPQRASPKIVHRSASNGSIPSTILIKRQLKKLKSQLTRKKHRNEMRVIRSKSTTMIAPKPEKTSHTRKGKNAEKVETSAPAEKKHKEGKSEFLKRLEAQFMMLARNLGMVDSSTTTYTYSELLATVDLETNQATPTLKKWPENPNENQIIMYSATKKRSRERGHRSKKKKSCVKECRERKKRRKLEEKCRRLEEGIDIKEKKKTKRRKSKEKPPKTKKKAHHCHRKRCRSCLLMRPWHPSCKSKTRKSKHSFQESCSSEERNYSSNTEYSSSQYTQRSVSYQDEPEMREYYPECKRSSMARNSMDCINRCKKPNWKTGLINTNLNLDQGLLKKFFRNIGRCYPRSSDKISINQKYCSKRKKKCSDHGSRRSGSEERYFHSELFGNERNSPPPCHHHAHEPQQYCVKRPHQQERNHQYWTYTSSPHNHGHHSRCRKGTEYVARCEYECDGAFMENRSLSSRSSTYQFEPLDDENKSRTSLRNRKSKKSKKSDTELPRFNPQVFLVHNEVERPDDPVLVFDPPDGKSLLCACERCGNVHRRTHKRHNRRSTDQKADRKVKRNDKYDFLLDPELAARFEEDFRREYGIYDDSNLGKGSDKTCPRFALSGGNTLSYSTPPSDDSPKNPSNTSAKPSNPNPRKYVTQGTGYNNGQSDLYSVHYKRDKYDAHDVGNKYPMKCQRSDMGSSFGDMCNQFDCRKFKYLTKYCCSSDDSDRSADRKMTSDTRISEKGHKSTKSKDKSKTGDTFPYFSFLDRILRFRSQKPTEEPYTFRYLKEKIEALEKRVKKIEKDLAKRYSEESDKRHKKTHRRKDHKGKCKKEIKAKPCKIKRDRCARKLERKERKLNKKVMEIAWAYRKLEELERRKRLKELHRMKICEARELKRQRKNIKRRRNCEQDAYYFTTSTPSMPQNEADTPPGQKESKSTSQRKVKDYFTNLQSTWDNFRFRKINLGIQNFWKRKRKSDSDELINDCSRSSRMPRTREVLEMKEEPTNFIRKHIKRKKSDKRIKGENVSQKSKSGKGRHR